MTVKQFIDRYRLEIAEYVWRMYGTRVSNDEECYEWLLNDETLFHKAHREGVNI